MNIFFLSDDPVQSAKWHVDKHMKMLLEVCQQLCTNYHLQGIPAPYRKTHENHPSTKWARESHDNFLWAVEYGYGLAQEYTERYGRRHKSHDVLDWCEENSWRLSFDQQDLTEYAIAIADDALCRQTPGFDSMTAIQKYREYYRIDKQPIHSWKQNKPNWI